MNLNAKIVTEVTIDGVKFRAGVKRKDLANPSLRTVYVPVTSQPLNVSARAVKFGKILVDPKACYVVGESELTYEKVVEAHVTKRIVELVQRNGAVK